MGFRDVLVRARVIVNGWDIEEISYAAEVVDYLLWNKGPPSIDAYVAKLNAQAADNSTPGLAEKTNAYRYWNPHPSRSELERLEQPSVVRGLNDRIDELGDPEVPGLPNATWAKLFAVAALAYVGDLCAQLSRLQQPERLEEADELSLHVLCLRKAGNTLTKATECISFARDLLDESAKATALRLQRREGKQHAAKSAKTAESARFINDYFKYADANPTDNLGKSIDGYLAQLSLEEAERFDDPARMIQRAIRDRENSMHAIWKAIPSVKPEGP